MTAEPVITGRVRPNQRQLAKAATVEKLIEAAAFLFANQGFFAVGVRDIARRMGMSPGALYANVGGKDALWRLALGGRAPDPALAEEVALLEARRPGWRWSLQGMGSGYVASVSSGGQALLEHDVISATGRGDTPAEAVRQARIQADRLAPIDPHRLPQHRRPS